MCFVSNRYRYRAIKELQRAVLILQWCKTHLHEFLFIYTMKILVLVIVSFDKPVYYDMLQLWKKRHLQNVWFIQCKPASEWIGDIVNDEDF